MGKKNRATQRANKRKREAERKRQARAAAAAASTIDALRRERIEAEATAADQATADTLRAAYEANPESAAILAGIPKNQPLNAEQLRAAAMIYGPIPGVVANTPECALCNEPFNSKRAACGHVFAGNRRFPAFDWKQRGCECPDPQVCLSCVQREAFRDGKRCCDNPLCPGIKLTCPWCRNDVRIADLFYDWVQENGDPESMRRAHLCRPAMS